MKKVLRSCILLRKLLSLSYGILQHGQRSAFCVQEDYAFSSAAFAGPLNVRPSSNQTTKAYIALCTCATPRAVHLEMVPDLKTETFLLRFQRVVSRGGLPHFIVTNNAKTLKAFSKSLQAIMKSSIVLHYLVEKRIRRMFKLSKALGGVVSMKDLSKGSKMNRRCITLVQ